MKTPNTEKLRKFYQMIAPHINGHKTSSNLFWEAIDEFEKTTSQIEDLTKEVEAAKEWRQEAEKKLIEVSQAAGILSEQNDRYREALEAVTTAVIEFLEKQPDKPYIANSKGSWTTHQLANEIKQQTPVGIDMIKSMMLLTADLILRGKEKLSTH